VGAVTRQAILRTARSRAVQAWLASVSGTHVKGCYGRGPFCTDPARIQWCIQFCLVLQGERWRSGQRTTANVCVRLRVLAAWFSGLLGWGIVCVLYSCSLVHLLHQASRLVCGEGRNKRSQGQTAIQLRLRRISWLQYAVFSGPVMVCDLAV
jgi:hypothetical protein